MSGEYKPSLTRLRLKNWRSIKEETIDFATPITVFIGANSSGKSNIIDALQFLRQVVKEGVLQAQAEREYRTTTVGSHRGFEVEFSYFFGEAKNLLTYIFGPYIPDEPKETPFERLSDSAGNEWMQVTREGQLTAQGKDGALITKNHSLSFKSGLSALVQLSTVPQIQQTFQFISQRWQILGENFMPPLSLPSGTSGDIYLMDSYARNLPLILNTMQKNEEALFEKLQGDVSWLLGHIDKMESLDTSREVRVALHEKALHQEAPTVSSGTARVLAMMAAYYALDMRNAEMPGLVVIEEPDTALNPWLLQNFVEQLRNYTERDGFPRQFILTTHNPYFLDYFQPEEVRVVERDEQGYTTVRKIPDKIREIWLDKHTLGEVWMTNSFGGVPE
jgi:predicted ATPase